MLVSDLERRMTASEFVEWAIVDEISCEQRTQAHIESQIKQVFGRKL